MDGRTASSVFKILSTQFATDAAEGMKAPLTNSVWAPETETAETIHLIIESNFLFFF